MSDPAKKIIEAAKSLSYFSELPITTQVTAVFAEIEEARNLKIPLAMICKALNDAGSKVSEKYLRDVLSVVKKQRTSKGVETAPSRTERLSHDQPGTQPEEKPAIAQNPKEAREEKANSYMTASNPLFAASSKKPK